MINNFEKIKELMKFESIDDFYYIQIIKRKKENPGLKNDTVLKDYYVSNFKYFDSKIPDMINISESNNARVTIRLNRRSYKKVANKLMIEIAKNISEERYESCKSAFSSMCGQYHSDPNKTWIIDIDKDDYILYDISDVSKIDEKIKIVDIIPSKTGEHLIVAPFDNREFIKKYPNLEIKKDSPTNLYIP